MKKTAIILVTLAIAALLLTGCARTETPPPGYTLTRSEASHLVLDAIGVDKSNATYTVVTENESSAAPCYDVEISVDGVVYRYRVDAAKGDVLKITVNDQAVAPEDVPTAESSPKADYIGLDAAKQIAYADAAIASEEILFFEYKMDFALGNYLYDIEFETATHEYEYEINAKDGSIFKKDVDGKTVITPAPDAEPSPDTAYIGVEAAEEAALLHAGKDRTTTVFEVTKWKMKKGIAIYDVEFVSSGVEYEYTVNALTGAIVSYKSEGFSQGTPAGAYIGEDAAKAAALAHAGLTENAVRFEDVEPDTKNGKTVYEIEFTSGGYEYEYTVDAESGDILKYEKDRD